MLSRTWLDEQKRASRRDSSQAEPPHLGWSVPDRITDRESLMRLLKVLGPRQRAVLVLRFYLDFSVEETAEILQITVGTVDTRFALVADSAESIEATARRLSESLDAALREAAPGAEWIFEPRIPGETGPDGQPMTMSHKECRLIRRPRGRIGMPLARGKGICKPNRPAVCGPSRTSRVGSFPWRADHEALSGL